MGTVNPSEYMEIASYLEKTLTSELSGNIIDLCRVEALTLKSYEFNARRWELEKNRIYKCYGCSRFKCSR